MPQRISDRKPTRWAFLVVFHSYPSWDYLIKWREHFAAHQLVAAQGKGRCSKSPRLRVVRRGFPRFLTILLAALENFFHWNEFFVWLDASLCVRALDP
jgi:hypothetical protein